jgi:hypothetical protein
MDKHTDYAYHDYHSPLSGVQDEFIEEYCQQQDESRRGELQNDLAESVAMDWAPANDDPHNQIHQLFTLTSFKPKEISANKKSASATAPTASIKSGEVPDARQLVRGQYRKYNEQQINELLRLVFVEHKLASVCDIQMFKAVTFD